MAGLAFFYLVPDELGLFQPGTVLCHNCLAGFVDLELLVPLGDDDPRARCDNASDGSGECCYECYLVRRRAGVEPGA